MVMYQMLVTGTYLTESLILFALVYFSGLSDYNKGTIRHNTASIIGSVRNIFVSCVVGSNC